MPSPRRRPISTATAAPISTWPAIPRPACCSTTIVTARSEQGLEAGVSLSEDGQEQAGMGLATGDFDTDGHLDIFKTHFRGDTNVLYRNNGKGYFRDVTIRAGLGVETRYVCWGAGIVDLDNDGLP